MQVIYIYISYGFWFVASKSLPTIQSFCKIFKIRRLQYQINNNSDWLRAYSQSTIACKVDMITQYVPQILGYQVEFIVCLVSKPLVCVLFSNVCKVREKCFLLQIV